LPGKNIICTPVRGDGNVITQTADPNSKPLGKFQAQYVLDGRMKYRVQATVIIDFPGDLVTFTK
jgi:hypothetical protein